MPQSIVNQPTPSQVSGRLATWHRVMEEAGLEYADLQKPIDDPKFRVDLVIFWRGRRGVLGKAAASPTPKPALVALPEIGVEFELTVDPAVQGLALMTAFDLSLVTSLLGFSSTNWQLKKDRAPLRLPLTRRFKLVSVGECRNLDEVRTKCQQFGRVPEGEFIEAFRKRYPSNDGHGPIGVADPSWVGPDGFLNFPMLVQIGSGWSPDFDSVLNERESNWRWLVEPA